MRPWRRLNLKVKLHTRKIKIREVCDVGAFGGITHKILRSIDF